MRYRLDTVLVDDWYLVIVTLIRILACKWIRVGRQTSASFIYLSCIVTPVCDHIYPYTLLFCSSVSLPNSTVSSYYICIASYSYTSTTYSSSSTTVVCKPLAEATGTGSTRANNFSLASSSSFLFLEILNLNLNGTPCTPLFHKATFNLGSNLTSVVLMCKVANFLISLTAFGALFLKWTPCN